MEIKDLEIQFRYLCGDIACMSVNSIDGKPVHNDINNDEAIKMFNALIGSKENSILEEYKQLQQRINKVIPLLCEADSWIMKKEYARANSKIYQAKEILKGGSNE